MNSKGFLVMVFSVFLTIFSIQSSNHCCKAKKTCKHNSPEYKVMAESLLRQWCDGMLRELIIDPSKPDLNGTLNCPACGIVHSRSMDAIYPFMKMAQLTGDKKYIEAAKAVFNAGYNVTQSDGSWTVVPNPKTWRGITIFGAIATAEALHYHGHLLDEETRTQWTSRLAKAADFIYTNFTTLEYSNINYGATAIYGMYLLGETFHEQKYLDRAQELASNIKNYMTKPNYLLFGEGKPVMSLSAKGLHPVDLGYNVEESLSGLVFYALAVKDTALLNLAKKTLEGHLEFMLADGGWDNSWGTRQAKWTYWGSRTSDGCAPIFGSMAHLNPAFGTAAYMNTQLLQQCTHNGLLHGGPHYASHGVPPCVHHTFAHAKPLALMLDMGDKLPEITNSTPLPRALSQKSKYFPELDTWLVARGPWRATVSAYDFIYKPEVQQATGGSISVLWHNKVGMLLAASMAKYYKVEEYNMQNLPYNEDNVLTPRIETTIDGVVYSNTFDLTAKINCNEKKKSTSLDIDLQLKDKMREAHKSNALKYKLNYTFDNKKMIIKAQEIDNSSKEKASMFLPIISQTGEKVTRINANKIEIEKKEGTVAIESNVALQIKKSTKDRIFNLVPGFEAVPVYVDLLAGSKTEVYCTISIK